MCSYEDATKTDSHSLCNNLILDSGSQRLIELTSRESRDRDVVEEILSILQRKAPKLLDGLAESNKISIAKQCQLKMYLRNDIVFLQGDEPDAYYTVIRGGVSIYALNSSVIKSEGICDARGPKDLTTVTSNRDQFGVFLLQLPPGESFGELSFNENGIHSRRNASIISDGSHGQARINSSLVQPDVEASDVCILLLIPEKTYMSEIFARHSAKHQTKDKIGFLKESLLFKHWTMDQLVKMAYSMKKKDYPKGSEVVRQGERMEYVWLVKEGMVRISHKVHSSQGRRPKSGRLQVDENNDVSSGQSLTVDVADLGQHDCIGLVESLDEKKKSQREATTLCSSEFFFVPLSFFKSMISQDSKTLSMIEKVVQRRKKWEFLRREYALKFPTMSMKIPKDASRLSHYAIRNVAYLPTPEKKPIARSQENTVQSDDTDQPCNDDSKNGRIGNIMRRNREITLDLLVTEAGL